MTKISEEDRITNLLIKTIDDINLLIKTIDDIAEDKIDLKKAQELFNGTGKLIALKRERRKSTVDFFEAPVDKSLL